ncbi:hypothetical protein BVC80_1065g62 [Macleaya cordata]|uniref:Uncharacterized protein n=1 Tax=Macleaya cordata TaxID=56857 RepID=A0A200RCT5_MACCD|nr:hypothetical protein BVC80_1065g62 [Macleaya cordata]
MKREGRQHGMVRSYMIVPTPLNPRLNSRAVNQFDTRPTAGLFTKVSTKPTNHSKFTGKCGKSKCTGCHVHPACKSKDKTKGTQKLKSIDVAMNHKLISWRVVDKGQGLNYRGISATAVLGQLSNDHWDDHVDDDDDHHDDGHVDDVYDDDSPVLADELPTVSLHVAKEEGASSGGIEEEEKDDDDDDDDDHMSFCDVGFVIDQVDGDEDWCLVGEL